MELSIIKSTMLPTLFSPLLPTFTLFFLFITSSPHSTHALQKHPLTAAATDHHHHHSSSNPGSFLTTTATSTTSTILQFLIPHNILRARHGLPPLQWSESVAQYARWWASQRQGDCRLIHSGSRRYGENIFYGWGKWWTPGDAVESWASEIRYYNYIYNVCAYGQECLHYTQMVWRQTRRIGCAQVRCSSGGTTFITCNYDPPGNIIGERPY